jgi:hypothetical protein
LDLIQFSLKEIFNVGLVGKKRRKRKMTCNCKKCVEEFTMDDFVNRYKDLLYENRQLKNRRNEQLIEYERLREEKRELAQTIEEKEILVNYLFSKQNQIKKTIEEYHIILNSCIGEGNEGMLPINEIQQNFINAIEQIMSQVYIGAKCTG